MIPIFGYVCCFLTGTHLELNTYKQTQYSYKQVRLHFYIFAAETWELWSVTALQKLCFLQMVWVTQLKGTSEQSVWELMEWV